MPEFITTGLFSDRNLFRKICLKVLEQTFVTSNHEPIQNNFPLSNSTIECFREVRMRIGVPDPRQWVQHK